MQRYKITAPVKTASGTVAGVRLVDGVGELLADQASALAYFRRHGYGVEPIVEDEPAGPAEPVQEDSATPDGGTPTSPVKGTDVPTRGASKDTWVAHVTSEASGEKRLTLDEATALKRDELAEHVLGPKTEGADQ